MYNSEKYIGNTIASILSQEEHSLNYEIIIVDDLSTDNSLQVVMNIKSDKIKIIELKKNGGTANARNTGIRIAQGEWIQFVDSDDRVCNDLYKKFELSKKLDINCYVFSMIIENHDNTLKRTITEIKDKRAFGYFYSVCNLFIKRNICMEFKDVFLQNEDVCFVFDMMNERELKISLIEDAWYIVNRKNDQSKMANFNKKKYRKMYSYLYNQIDKSDDITKMFMLETFVGILFSAKIPLSLSLPIATKTLFRLYKYLPRVYSNGIRNCVRDRMI